ncbi:hypothetical protein [Bacillus sp. FJAT-49736]|uniref:hypothetical protein n=1 Tax=Bacillus sp. FJAT-49736 TaxID=2833582 RepID=UPI001BC9CB0C|nr:hypothetical protein [Bacillus sp. FJAT-49736]MBS4174815.1 hypothetical protein [Bacillus sp. FJAT-49736]MBS4175528.1 hypothetical protein [Bacillus sp. FJAT-49736]
MTKNYLSGSIIFFGVCLLISAWWISSGLRDIQFSSGTGEVTVSQQEQANYELIIADKKNLILFNKEVGEYWIKSIDNTGTSNGWVHQPAPGWSE